MRFENIFHQLPAEDSDSSVSLSEVEDWLDDPESLSSEIISRNSPEYRYGLYKPRNF